jgi:hypothetical protein
MKTQWRREGDCGEQGEDGWGGRRPSLHRSPSIDGERGGCRWKGVGWRMLGVGAWARAQGDDVRAAMEDSWNCADRRSLMEGTWARWEGCRGRGEGHEHDAQGQWWWSGDGGYCATERWAEGEDFEGRTMVHMWTPTIEPYRVVGID